MLKSEGHSSGIPTIQEELEKNGSKRAEFFTDEDRRATRIRIPIHEAFLEKTTNIEFSQDGNISDKKKEQYNKIISLLTDGNWHKTSEFVDVLGLKETRTKELLRELVDLNMIIDNDKIKGKSYKLI